jgi:hypothetical protein
MAPERHDFGVLPSFLRRVPRFLEPVASLRVGVLLSGRALRAPPDEPFPLAGRARRSGVTPPSILLLWKCVHNIRQFIA